MSLWDDTPPSLTNGGALAALQPVLDSIDTPTHPARGRAGHTGLGSKGPSRPTR